MELALKLGQDLEILCCEGAAHHPAKFRVKLVLHDPSAEQFCPDSTSKVADDVSIPCMLTSCLSATGGSAVSF
jgi:hypothetical protein